ncbi:MAG: iron ABC transporter permease [Chloroflexi bacterium]|nr:iron ABC transporter permease [Chloroflexota bacterium]
MAHARAGHPPLAHPADARRSAPTVGLGTRQIASPLLRLRAVALLVTLVMLIPLFFVVSYTVATGWSEAYRLLVRPRVGELFFNTTRLAAATVLACAAIGVGTAWLTERTDLPFRRFWSVLLVAPLAVPSFVNSYVWVSLTPHVEGYAGAVLIVTLSYFPYVYLPVAAVFRGLDPAFEESSRALGHGPWRTFAFVVIPLLRPALLGGMLLVALHLLAEFGALQMLRFPTFTTAIYDQYQSTFNGPAANMLAGVLVACCLIALFGELVLRGRGRFARIGAGSARPAPRVRLGAAKFVVLVLLGLLIALALGVPLGGLVYWLRVSSAATLDPDLLVSTGLTSIGLGLAGAAVTTLLALPVAWLAVRHPDPVSTLAERASYVGHALPGIVVALALVTVSVSFARPIYQTTALLLVAYAILFVPLALVSIRAALAQAPAAYDDVGRSLGVSPLAVFVRITLPNIARGLGAGAALVFIGVVTELTATLLLAPIGTDTLATRFWGNADSIAYGAAAPYAALMVAISAPMIYLLTRQTVRGAHE